MKKLLTEPTKISEHIKSDLHFSSDNVDVHFKKSNLLNGDQKKLHYFFAGVIFSMLFLSLRFMDFQSGFSVAKMFKFYFLIMFMQAAFSSYKVLILIGKYSVHESRTILEPISEGDKKVWEIYDEELINSAESYVSWRDTGFLAGFASLCISKLISLFVHI